MPSGNPNGNPGNKGGGRQNAIEERRNWDLLWDMYSGKIDRDELLKKIEGGNYSIHEALMAKALAGNTMAQIAIFNKIFPDSLVVKHLERSLQVNVIQMTDEKYEKFIEGEYRRLGLDRRLHKGRAK